MRSRATQRFWTAYRELPAEIRQSAKKSYALFRDNPAHPSLNFKKVHNREPVYSVRVTYGYRAVGLLEDNEITWFWIGTRTGYERLLAGDIENKTSSFQPVHILSVSDTLALWRRMSRLL